MLIALSIEAGSKSMQEVGGMIQKYKFVEQNISMLRHLTKEGYITHRLLFNYNLYKSYMGIKNERKMIRYRTVAKEMNTSVMTVRRAVSEMKAYVKD